MPQPDPIHILTAQGFPPDLARRMVESGDYEHLIQSPTLDFSQLGGTGIGGFSGSTSSALSGINDTGSDTRIQMLLDQGYNMEEAQQLLASENFTPDKMTERTEGTGATDLATPGGGINQFTNLPPIGGGISLDSAAFGLGQSLGSEKGIGRGIGIVANASKIALGSARNILSGLGQAKRNQHIQDFLNKKRQEGTGRTTFTPAPQAANVNYLGGQSYGEDGGIHKEGQIGYPDGGVKGETLLLKDFLTNKGFTKPGFKKLP